MQDYYAYRGTSLCGIPEMTLPRHRDDYRAIATRARLAAHGLGWWAQLARRRVRAPRDAADGQSRHRVLPPFYKRDESSGGPHMNGWINCLFPFEWHYTAEKFDVSERARRTLALAALRHAEHQDNHWQGVKQEAPPRAVACTPHVARLAPPAEYRYELIAGFVGSRGNRRVVRCAPGIGWAVRELV